MTRQTDHDRDAGPTGLARFAPGLAALANYQGAWLRSDVAAGISVAAVALPVGIAYAGLAGVPPVVGIYAAIFPLFAYALFGSSRQLMTGPDAATCMMVAAILAPLAGGDPARYQALMVVLTLCTGLLYVVAGFARFGFIANFLSLPILTGFLNGIALIIVVGQLPKLLGYEGTASGFFAQLGELADGIGELHVPTAALGVGLVVLLVALRRWVPRLPNPLIVVVAGIGLVVALGLDARGVALLGAVPAGLPPAPSLPSLDAAQAGTLLRDAAALVLVSFTSGILTAKSFAQRNRYTIDANQELVGFGAANLASGLAQGFPVTGADSRTAINNAMGGKTQLVGIVAGATMLIVLFFVTGPLAYVPNAALAAVIIVSAVSLFDLGTLRQLYGINRSEFAFSAGTTLGVLVLGVLPGVLLAVVLSLIMLLAVTSRPRDEVLGRVEGMKGFHSLEDFPDAKTVPGLLLYRFDADVVFYNADYFAERLLAAVERQEQPVEWVVVDMSPVNIVDVTAINRFDELRRQLQERGIHLYVTRPKQVLGRFFDVSWLKARRELNAERVFPTLKSAVKAYEDRPKRP
jgi:high affinity sulfate transporter 1